MKRADAADNNALVLTSEEVRGRAGWPGARRKRDSDGRPAGMYELCHDVRGPAATIAALVAAAMVEGEPSEVLQRRLSQIAAEAKRISEVCRELLGETERRPIELGDVAETVVAAVRLTTSVALTLVVEPAQVVGNAVGLGRALGNLVENAVRAAGPEGEVSVVVARAGDCVDLVVADSGDGFGRGEPGAAGLGLRIATRIVSEHGGDLRVGRSQELGGAEVSISLPLAANRQLAVAR